MNDSSKKEKELGNIYIILLLLIGFILRFTISFIHSYSSDELSAICRLKFDGFNSIIENAVMHGDMHPAGVQLFEEFWSSLFGTSEIALRLPFVFMGVGSIWLIYLIGKNYLTKKAGIFSAALLTITYFPIIHSELARPYSPGLLFSLLVAWFWLRLIFPNGQTETSKKLDEKSIWISSIALSLSFALAMYTHYFAFMFVGFIGITGLFFLRKEIILPYIFAGGLAILLYLPHLHVTIHHLSQDGGLQWLGPPDNSWLFQFIFHVFNESWLLFLSIIGLLIFAVFNSRGTKKQSSVRKAILIFSVWFFGIYIIGHLFSLLSSPILKFPIMLFPLPFLLLLIASFFSNLSNKVFGWTFGVLLLIGGFSTIYEKDLYGNKHFGVFKELVEPMIDWRTKYGVENITTYMNVSDPAYLNYYAIPMGDSLTFNKNVMGFSEDIPIREELLNMNTDYCIVGYSARLTVPQIFETCKEFYPVILDYRKLNNCAVFLLAKKGKPIIQARTKVVSEFKPGELNKSWQFNRDKIEGEFYISDSTNIYGPNYIFKRNTIDVDFDYNLRLIIEGEANAESQLTVNLTAKRNGKDATNEHGENIWMGKDLEAMLSNPSDQNNSYFILDIPNRIKGTDDIQISLWNRNGKPFKVKTMKIEVVENLWN